MRVLETRDYMNHYTWFFILESNHIYTYNFGGTKEIKKYNGSLAELKQYFGSILIDGFCDIKNISDNLDLHFQNIAKRIETLDHNA